jgi:hypothetical protein
MTQERKLILLSDFIDQRVRKQQELEYYQAELEKLQEKMYWLRRDIDLTTTIIDIIEKEKVIDVKAQYEKKLITKTDQPDEQ